MVINWLRFLRWPNLAMIAFAQYLIRFSITEALGVPHRLSEGYFALGVLTSITLAASGYIINDLYDRGTDQRNKPGRLQIGKSISESAAWSVYFVLTAIAVAGGYALAWHIDMEDLWIIVPVAAGLLYLYAIDFKARPVLGNLIVSILTALPIALVAVYDILPAEADPKEVKLVQDSFRVVMFYSLFAFWFNWMREMIKDAQDIPGDAAEGYRTLAVILGAKRLRWIPWIMGVLAWIAIGLYTVDLLEGDPFSAGYLSLLVLAPLLYFLIRLPRTERPQDFASLSTLLKIIMLTGILSMLVFTLSLQLRPV